MRFINDLTPVGTVESYRSFW